MHENTPSIDLQAAQLALLGLRSSVPTEPQHGELFQILPDSNQVSTQTTLEYLAHAPKPLRCTARSVRGVVQLDCQPLANFPDEYTFHRRCLEDHRAKGGIGSFLLAHYGGSPHTLNVACFGGDECILLPLEAVEAWYAQFSGFGFIADRVSNPRAATDPHYIKAKELGALGILRFSKPQIKANEPAA